MQSNTRNYLLAGGQRDFSSYYTADSDRVVLVPQLLRNIVFSHHNLVSDGSFNEFHVILCRNVMIYFNSDLRDRVFQLFHRSLIRFGILALGLKESLSHSSISGDYEPLAGDVQIYRRRRGG